MNISEAKQVLMATHEAALNTGVRASAVEMRSGPGVGKSAAVFQQSAELAKKLGEPVGLVQFMLATISSVDVRGFLLPHKAADGSLDSTFSTPPWMPTRPNTIVFEPDGTMHKAGTWSGDIPRVGNLFLDEWGQAEDEVKKPAAELLYTGAVGTARLPALWRVVAASNRLSDRSGVLREMMFIVNRRLALSIDAHLPTWLNWANAQPPESRPHYLSLSFAQKNPDLVFREAVPPGAEPFCTPRTLCLLDKDLAALRSAEDIKKDRLPLDSLAREVATGWIGGGEAAQFFTHLKYADELPDIGDIEKDPSKAKLPPNRDAQMVCGYMLAHNVTDKNASPLMAYIKRLHIEMQVLAMRAITSQQERAAHIVSTTGFTNWLREHKDLLIASRS